MHNSNILQEPETIELGKTYCWQKSGNRNKLVEKKDTFQYVPLLDSLASLMQNKDVYNEVLHNNNLQCPLITCAKFVQISKSHQRDDNLLEDFYDGSLLKSHPVFKDDHTALQLIAYYDDVEVCNPLGSHRGVNKLGNLVVGSTPAAQAQP